MLSIRNAKRYCTDCRCVKPTQYQGIGSYRKGVGTLRKPSTSLLRCHGCPYTKEVFAGTQSHLNAASRLGNIAVKGIPIAVARTSTSTRVGYRNLTPVSSTCPRALGGRRPRKYESLMLGHSKMGLNSVCAAPTAAPSAGSSPNTARGTTHTGQTTTRPTQRPPWCGCGPCIQQCTRSGAIASKPSCVAQGLNPLQRARETEPTDARVASAPPRPHGTPRGLHTGEMMFIAYTGVL